MRSNQTEHSAITADEQYAIERLIELALTSKEQAHELFCAAYLDPVRPVLEWLKQAPLSDLISAPYAAYDLNGNRVDREVYCQVCAGRSASLSPGVQFLLYNKCSGNVCCRSCGFSLFLVGDGSLATARQTIDLRSLVDVSALLVWSQKLVWRTQQSLEDAAGLLLLYKQTRGELPPWHFYNPQIREHRQRYGRPGLVPYQVPVASAGQSTL